MLITVTKKWSRLPGILNVLWLACVVALTLEGAARVDDWVHYDAPLFREYDFSQLIYYSDNGPRGVPHGRYMRWTLNAYGLHGPEIPADAGQTRVVVFGASEVFGMYEDADKVFPRILEIELNARTAPEKFDVLNAGIPGTRIGSIAPLLRELHTPFRPSVVVIYPTPTAYIGVSQQLCGRPQKFVPANELRSPGLRVGKKFKEQMKLVLPTAAMTFLRRISIAWQMRGQDPLDRISPASIDAFEADLHCILSTVKELGMVPILVTHANVFGGERRPDDADRLTQWRQQYPAMREGGFIDLEEVANRTIRRVALVRGTILVDAAVAISGQPVLFADHAHLTNEGATKMGVLLAPAVMAALDGSSR